MTAPIDRSALRRQLRLKRKSLTPSQQAKHALGALSHLEDSPLYTNAQHIGLYWAADAELDPALIAAHAHMLGKSVYLPVVRRQDHGPRQLTFLAYEKGQPLAINAFGIPEPMADAAIIAPDALDIVLVPLVGLDNAGNRLGMGGGFYDTTFAFKKQGVSARPLLIGLAHQCQLTEALNPEDWDVPLDGWLSEEALVMFSPR